MGLAVESEESSSDSRDEVDPGEVMNREGARWMCWRAIRERPVSSVMALALIFGAMQCERVRECSSFVPL